MNLQRFPAPLACLLLAGAVASALAQGRPANRRAEAPAGCVVSEFRAMALGTHDLAERTRQATDWFRRNAPACGEDQLRLLASNRMSWMGNADSPQLMALMDGALEARLKNRPELMGQLFGAAPPPPRPPGSDTIRAGDLAPRPAPVVPPATPAAVGAGLPVVVPAAPGMPPGALPEPGKHFNPALRGAVRDHFLANRGTGPCPAGLILKNGRCESPVSERLWKIGQPLPTQLQPKEAPAPLLEKLGPPPADHSYVLLDGDLLLLNNSSRLVVDSVLDLGGIPPRA